MFVLPLSLHEYNLLLSAFFIGSALRPRAPSLSSWLEARHCRHLSFDIATAGPELTSINLQLGGNPPFPLGKLADGKSPSLGAGQIGSSRRRRDSAIRRASSRGANICITEGHISALLTGTEMGRAAAVAEFGEPPVRGTSANIPPT
jgi:hypothetical protein